MAVYKLSSKAEIDLAEMYEFGIYKFGLSQAQKYFYSMHETFEVLSENMNLGRDASEFISDLKRFAYKAHTIFYLHTASGIFILRVLSQHMDYERNL
ncbi:type II toxin-antitoxin system RelE/ParE family toxin [Costertonia aggregata]|uniref:Toxin n=1 Tax=Costertonia aggregata TaxID=343403 RepID=A0A7H9AU65_9FLAO|nr:type II toxin-antitoxin system RelE/ParE family toxin [Costertonia aggregata]QLG46937.1 type II toxin-antitoxin system RelE/ParE family toxin [Costertonia aggregata]